MPEVVLSNLCKKFGKVAAVDHINLTVRDKEFLTLLGPSGCGKTTTLRMIAGFFKPDSGEIRVGDRIISSAQRGLNIVPEKRKMSMVFQSYALWPHMNVLENVMFGLRARKVPVGKAKERTIQSLDLVKLGHLTDRFPHQLSGGQQQRVAFARAIATEPDVLLLDEPLSNLDAKLRESMRFELRQLHDKLNITTIYVTHDQAEAIILSDKICLMYEGRILQSCPPKEIYDKPNCCTVADFIGITNLLPATIVCDSDRNKGVLIRSGDIIYLHEPIDLPDKKEVTISIRPENIRIYTNYLKKNNMLKGKVISKTFMGNYIDYLVAVEEEIIRIHDFNTDTFCAEKEEVYLCINPDKVVIISEKMEIKKTRSSLLE
ncbi:MAG: ABC transporter ATP-binding protein [Thermodesulfobacteriota bacterium]|nr:ABC transporter ATP-binding protein [Thermodesulfobacteriota bacterium]